MNNAPGGLIDDFRPMTETRVSPVYFKEADALSNTRLWFGPEDNGFAVRGDKTALLLARRSTRIYAAGSNPLTPGKEEAANAQSEAFLGWWNDHYEEVAAYEPEYQRLNEVMKWSLIVGWLNDAGKGEVLGFLDGYPVDHKAWFPDWVRRPRPAGVPPLRFHRWDAFAFYPSGHLGTTTEAMPLLSSEAYDQGDGKGAVWTLSGGVSLARKDLFTARAALPELASDVPLALRRANVDYSSAARGAVNEVKALSGTRYSFVRPGGAAGREASAVTAVAKDGAKLRGRFSEMRPEAFRRVVEREPGGLRLTAAAGEADVGALQIDRTGRGYRVQWDAGGVERGLAVARDLSRKAVKPADLLDADRRVESAVALAGRNEYLIKLAGSDKWMHVAEEVNPTVALADGWQSRVAYFEAQPSGPAGLLGQSRPSRSLNVKWVNAETAARQIPENAVVRIRTGGAGGGEPPRRLDVVAAGFPDGGRPVELVGDGFVIKGRAADGALYVRASELPAAVRADPARLGGLGRSPEVRAAAPEMFKAGSEPVRVKFASVVPDADVPAAVRELRSKDWRGLADEIGGGAGRGGPGGPGGPGGAGGGRRPPPTPEHLRAVKGQIEADLEKDLRVADKFLADQSPERALALLDKLIAIHGPKPDLSVRRALAEIGAGRPAEAAEALNEAGRQGLKGDGGPLLRELGHAPPARTSRRPSGPT